METDKKGKILVIGVGEEFEEILSSFTFFEVCSASSVAEGIDFALQNQPEYLFISLEFDGGNGIDICREIRQNLDFGKTYIVLLSSEKESFLEIHALQSGADEYWVLPLSKRLITARISSLMRRKPLIQKELKTPSVITESRGNKISLGEDLLSLPRKEFEILNLFKQHPKKVFSREEIIASIWGQNVNVNERTIDVHIKSLRNKIGDNKIVTIKGVGYKLEV